MKKTMRFIVPILFAVLLVGSIVWYLFVFDRDFTRDMLLKQARYNDTHGNSRISAWFYSMAYIYSDKDEDVAIELANQYIADGNFTKAEVTLSNAINAEPTAELYTALCRTYVAQDKLMDAVALLSSISNPEIRAELDAQRPTAPVPDQAPGLYSQYIRVGLSSSSGRLLYTTTGEYPSIADAPYTEPIQLEAGETVIYCISVDNDGLVSPVSILGYVVGGVIEPAQFQNPAIDLAVRELLEIETSRIIYTNELWTIREFTVPEGVTELDDLALLTSLEKLTINNAQLNNLSTLGTLTKLQELDLTGCRFPSGELQQVARLPELRKLVLAQCGLSTIVDLTDAVKLQYLDLSDNTVRNLEVISAMTGLRELYMPHNALVTLEALAPLSSLERLDVSYNSLNTLAPLASCVKLSWLNAANNQITATTGIAALPLLSSLSLNYNLITDISELGACVQMKELSISNNQISDISYLASMTNLEIFDFSYNSVFQLPGWPEGCALRVIDGSYNALSNLDVLSKMQSLTFVSLDYNQLTSVDMLAACPNLVQVNVYGNAIPSVAALTEHNIIVNYDPTAAEG